MRGGEKGRVYDSNKHRDDLRFGIEIQRLKSMAHIFGKLFDRYMVHCPRERVKKMYTKRRSRIRITKRKAMYKYNTIVRSRPDDQVTRKRYKPMHKGVTQDMALKANVVVQIGDPCRTRGSKPVTPKSDGRGRRVPGQWNTCVALTASGTRR